jgi:hypothetical protein
MRSGFPGAGDSAPINMNKINNPGVVFSVNASENLSSIE